MKKNEDLSHIISASAGLINRVLVEGDRRQSAVTLIKGVHPVALYEDSIIRRRNPLQRALRATLIACAFAA